MAQNMGFFEYVAAENDVSGNESLSLSLGDACEDGYGVNSRSLYTIVQVVGFRVIPAQELQTHTFPIAFGCTSELCVSNEPKFFNITNRVVANFGIF